MISRFFIDRPVFASVLSIIIVFAGLASLRSLPVSQYPRILPTEISVSATYPGASAEVVNEAVAVPIENQINGVPNMLYMTSSSRDSGHLNISVVFDLDVDPAQAQIDINNRVQTVISSLPAEVKQNGVQVKRRSDSILQAIVLYSTDDKYDLNFMSTYAVMNINDNVKRVLGVGDASLFAPTDYAIRIWLRPDIMSQYAVSVDDVKSAVKEQNSQFAAGKFAEDPMSKPQDFCYIVTSSNRFSNVKEFENIIIRTDKNGSSLYLKDIARIELGSANYGFISSFDKKLAVVIGVYLQTGANALQTAKLVKDKINEISKKLPPGLKAEIPFDTTTFVNNSINEVIKTLAESIILVMLVIYLFLQNYRATLISLVAIPISLIGTFAGMYALGFSVNLLTLFGLILAIGIVVDDAIVVLENVERIMRDQKLPPKEATIKAMEEVSGPIIAIVLSLCAVFVPIGFLGGLTGVIYRQFAITIAISVVFSGIVSLTLTPALCANFIDHSNHEGPLLNKFNLWFSNLTNYYVKGVKYFLERTWLSVGITASVMLIIAILFTRLPTSLIPDDDQGYLFVAAGLMPASSLDRTGKLNKEIAKRIMNLPEVEHVVGLTGLDFLAGGLSTSAAANVIGLKDWKFRKQKGQDAQSIANKIMGLTASLQDGMVFAFNPPAIMGMSRSGGFEFYLQYHGNENGTKILTDMTNKFVEIANKTPGLAGVRSLLAASIPKYHIELDRIKAKALNVNVTNVFSTLQSTLGYYYINDFSLYGRNYSVLMQAESDFRSKPDDLSHIYVKSDDGNMVPISSLVTVSSIVSPDTLDRFNIFPAAKIMGSGAPGVSSGQAIALVEKLASELLNQDFSIGWVGSAYQEKRAEGSGSTSFIFGVIMVFLILAALYERWSLPLAVVLAIPFAVLGSLIAVYLRGLANDVYFQIGLVTLVGLSAKNAILIVEFALMKTNEGIDIVEAALEAAKLRFRPIIMTSLAFILGCLPLCFSTGAGAASRHSIGTGVVGGMILATAIAPLFIPLFFKLIYQVSEKVKFRSTNPKSINHE